MVVAGFLLKANEVRIVCLNGNRGAHTLVASKFNKLSLIKNPSQEDVSTFILAINGYCAENNIEKVVINRRASKGQGAGGAGTFLMEGAILATLNVGVELIHPATVRATDKRTVELKALKPKTVDLGKAYDLAFELLT